MACLGAGHFVGRWPLRDTLRYLGTTGYLDFTHSFHPPLRANTLLYPMSFSFCAKLALVPSLGQAQ